MMESYAEFKLAPYDVPKKSGHYIVLVNTGDNLVMCRGFWNDWDDHWYHISGDVIGWLDEPIEIPTPKKRSWWSRLFNRKKASKDA